MVDIPIVDWLNLISSTPSNNDDVLTVDDSPNPLPVITSPVSESTNLTCKPKRVVCVALEPLVALTTSSSETEKS